jgi:DNA polymerase I-like protein with 3'-5' exonuclease and polymerase domains
VATGFYGLYPKFRGPDGRIHPKLLTCHVLSGRTASADPNCQQIPKESTWEFVDFNHPSSDFCAACPDRVCQSCVKVQKKTLRTAAREAFLPREGYIFIEGDYSQIELMVLAGVSNETKMLQAFQNGEDVHGQTASLIFSIPQREVSKEQRQAGKTANFRFTYGGGPRGLADQTGIPLEQAFEINRAYSRAYPMIDSFASRSVREAFEKGYVETLFGRRRYMEEFKATDPKMRARGRRLAVNLQVQGGAADIAKIGLVRQDRAQREFDSKFSCRTYLINFVHDSFLWEIPIISKNQLEQTRFIEEFTESMRKALCFDVSPLTGISQFPDLKVDFKIGLNYHVMIERNEWLSRAGEA